MLAVSRGMLAGLAAVGVGGALVAALELRDAGGGGLAAAVLGAAAAAGGGGGGGGGPDQLLGLLLAAELARVAACGGLFIAATRLWFVRRAQADAAAEVLRRRQRTLRAFSTQVLDRLHQLGATNAPLGAEDAQALAAFREWYLDQLALQDLALGALECGGAPSEALPPQAAAAAAPSAAAGAALRSVLTQLGLAGPEELAALEAGEVVALPPAKGGGGGGSSGGDLRSTGGIVPSSERCLPAAADAAKREAARRAAKQPWRAVLEWGLRRSKPRPPSPPQRGGGAEWSLARDRARLERALQLRTPEDKKQHHRAFQELLEEMRGAAERSLAASVEEGSGGGGGGAQGGGGGEEAEGSDSA